MEESTMSSDDTTTDAIVKCDGCAALGRRAKDAIAPDFWFYIESEDRTFGKGGVYVVWACSEACRDGLWKRGPGRGQIDDAGTRRARERGLTRRPSERDAARSASDQYSAAYDRVMGERDHAREALRLETLGHLDTRNARDEARNDVRAMERRFVEIEKERFAQIDAARKERDEAVAQVDRLALSHAEVLLQMTAVERERDSARSAAAILGGQLGTAQAKRDAALARVADLERELALKGGGK